MIADEWAQDRLRLLERAVSAIQNGIMITDATRPDDPIVYVNPAFERITGYAPEEAIGRNPRFLQAGDGDQPALDALRAARKANDDDVRWTGVLRNYRKDGALFYNELTAAAVRDGKGRVANHIGVISDVTQRERAEERVRFQARLLDAVGQAVVAVDLSGRIVYWNRFAEGLYGWSAEEAVGRPIGEVIIVPEDQAGRAEEIWSELVAGRGWSGEFVVGRRDGSVFPAMVTDTPVLDERGDLVGVIGVSTDITERKRAEEALRESERRFRQLFEHSVDALFVLDPETREVLDCNSEACRSLGYHRGELLELRLGGFAREILSEEERARRGPSTPWRRALSGEPGTIIGFHENVHRRKDGTTFPVEVGVGPIEYAGGRMILASARDATERKRAEEALKKSEAGLAEAQRVAGLGSWEWDVGTDEVRWSDEVFRLLGHAPGAFVPSLDVFLNAAHPDERGPHERRISEALREGGAPYDSEHRLLRPDGEVRVVHCRGEVERDGNGEPLRMVGTVHDVTQRRALEERLEHLAFHDPLTGLPNRALFLDRLEQALVRADRREGRVAMLFLDLDRFKVVNDSLGHDAGDELLVAVAERLRGCLRPEDTVARLGGDEFVVLLEDVGDRGYAERVSERIAEALRGPVDLEGNETYVTASIGVVLNEAGHARPPEMLRDADIAMYAAKDAGKARHEVFDEGMKARAHRRLELENRLRRAIEREELRVHYQPKVDLSSGAVVGMEALVRWQDPERGLIYPAEFVPLAEETGLILPLGRWVLGEACRQAKEWRERYPGADSLTVAVNLSAKQFQQPNLAEEVDRALGGTGLDPGALILEITEGVLMEKAQSNMETLRGMKTLGVKVAIDDFGTGYSSLGYLKRFPVDMIKVDRSFVCGLGQDTEDTAIVETVLLLARALGLRAVAEGIETAEQMEELRALGCPVGQGYYFARPMPSDEAGKLLEQNVAG